MASDTRIFESLRVSRRRLHEQIADHLEETIVANQLAVGTQLPPERVLAQHFGVTRTTVHQAMTVLEQRGLVEIRGGAGVYVTEVPLSSIVESIQRYFSSGHCSPDDLGALREILEPEEASLAAQRATPDDVAKLKVVAERFDEPAVVADAKTFTDVDMAFHELVAVATHNSVLVAVTVALHRVFVAWMNGATRLWSESVYARSAPLHRPVYEAIAAGDPDRARRAMGTSVHFCVASKEGERGARPPSATPREEVEGLPLP